MKTSKARQVWLGLTKIFFCWRSKRSKNAPIPSLLVYDHVMHGADILFHTFTHFTRASYYFSTLHLFPSPLFGWAKDGKRMWIFFFIIIYLFISSSLTSLEVTVSISLALLAGSESNEKTTVCLCLQTSEMTLMTFLVLLY